MQQIPSGHKSFPVTAPGQQLHFIKTAGDSFSPVCLDASLSLGGMESKVEEVSWPCLWGGLGVGVDPLEQERHLQRDGLLSIRPGAARAGPREAGESHLGRGYDNK